MKYIVHVKPTENNREWEVLRDLFTPWCVVPKGFIFDGCSIPVGLRWMFPHGGKKFTPGCTTDTPSILPRHASIWNSFKSSEANLPYLTLPILLSPLVPGAFPAVLHCQIHRLSFMFSYFVTNHSLIEYQI